MKPFYIFLDIDGVMNDFEYWTKCKKKHGNGRVMSLQNYPFNPDSLNNLMLLNQELQHKQYATRIILSSTWRLGENDTAIVNSRLAEYGMQIYDKTSQLDRMPLNKLTSFRSFEIKEWLKTHKNPTNYIILDDADVSDEFEEKYYVKTNPNVGFNKDKLQEAIEKVCTK